MGAVTCRCSKLLRPSRVRRLLPLVHQPGTARTLSGNLLSSVVVGRDAGGFKLPPCMVGIGADATSHYCARELTKLSHDVKRMAAQYVKPQKNDRADAEAMAKAVTRPT